MELRIVHRRSEKVEQIRVEIEDDGHAGGDLILAESFVDLIKGRASQRRDVPRGSESARTKTFQQV